MLEFSAPSSHPNDIKQALSLAVDFARPETQGLEEGGDIRRLFNVNQAFLTGVIDLRVIRQVLDASKEWGAAGSVVETTSRDKEIARTTVGRPHPHWYLPEGLSPAVLVFDGVKGTKPFEIYSSKDAELSSAVFFSGLYSTAALPQAGMTPRAIWEFMREQGVYWDAPSQLG